MPETLEAEVIEIDGERPSVRDGRGPFRMPGGFRLREIRLDPKWWPLWLLGGLVFAVLALAVVLVGGALLLLGKLLASLLSGALNLLGGRSPDGFRPRRM